MASLFAYLHFLAAFTFVAALAVEFILIRDPLDARNARRLLIADAIYGSSATIVLIAGFVRVFWFEKGAGYYFHSAAFIAKVALFVIVALLSIYPTVTFLSWRKGLAQGAAPTIAPEKVRTIRRIIHWELAGIAILVLMATLMARGVGHFA